MSNLQWIAQTTQPITSPFEMAVLAGVVVGIPLSVIEIRRRRLWELPPIPDASSHVNGAILGGILITAVAAYMVVTGVIARLMGLDAALAATPQGMRLFVMAQPGAQIAGATVILGMLALIGAFPAAIQWYKVRLADVASAAGWYLLAIPWVLLTGILVGLLLKVAGQEVPKGHAIFEIWKAEAAGFTPFKTLMFLSATVTAPLVEELVFRGLLQRLLRNLTHQPALAILLTSLAFAAIHQPWTIRPSIFMLSVLLGWAYFRSGSIVLVILIHAIFNGLQFAMFLAAGE